MKKLLALLAVIIAAGFGLANTTDTSKPGTVTGRTHTYGHCTGRKGHRFCYSDDYGLKVTAGGKTWRVDVGAATYRRCTPGERWPTCAK